MNETTTIISKSSRKVEQSNRSKKSIRTKNAVESIKETEKKRDILDRNCTSVAEDMFGTKVNGIIILDPEFIAKMEQICDVGPIPSELLLQLQNSGINTPHILVNTFGGGTAALAKQIMFMKVSIFLDKHPIITRRLIAMSRFILNLDFNLLGSSSTVNLRVSRKEVNRYICRHI